MILIIAIGRTDLEFKWNLITLLITPTLIYFGAKKSIEWASIMLLFSMVLYIVPSWWYLLKQTIGVTLKEYILAIVTIKKLGK